MEVKNGFVYWIHKKEHTNISEDGYVGITNNINKRWNAHKNNSHCVILAKAIKKYGAENLVWEVVFTGYYNECEEKEKSLRPNFNIGWNILKGGGNTNAAVGRKLTINHKQNIAKGNTGRVISKSTKDKISASNKGKKMSKETRKKMSKSKLGTKHSEETKRKVSIANKGNTGGNENLTPGANKKQTKCVETNTIYPSAKDASEAMGINHSNITQVCKGKRKSAGGFTWEYT